MSARLTITALAVLFILGTNDASAQCTAYSNLPRATSPGELMQDLNAALYGKCEVFKWREHWQPSHQSMASFDVGSQNLSVVAAAISLVRDTSNPQPAVSFFMKLFGCQTTPGRCTATESGQPSVSHFKGKEIVSNIYDYAVVDAALVANWWAREKENSVANAKELQPFSRAYLRKTWSIYALAAGRTWARELQDDNTLAGVNTGNGCGQNLFKCNINPNNDNLFFSGPFLALAGLRSKPGQRACFDDRAVQFAHAINWSSGSFANQAENRDQAAIRSYVKANWDNNIYGESVFALNPSEEQLLKNHIQSDRADYVDTLVSVIANGGTRFFVPMHFIGWSDGSRLTYLEYHHNDNPGGTVYALKFEPVTQRAHLHYPFHASKNGPYRQVNKGRVAFGNYGSQCNFATADRLETWNQPCTYPAPDGDCKHEERRLTMPLPASTKIYEVKIDSTGVKRIF